MALFKFMIQADTAKELREMVLAAAESYGATVPVKHEGDASLAKKMKEFTEKPAEQNLKDFMDKNPAPGTVSVERAETPMSRAEAAEARINAAFETPVPTPTQGPTDSRGVIWHKDFHSANKSTNKDGSWRSQRGVSKEAIDAYESQFLGKGRSLSTNVATSEPASPQPPQNHIEQPVHAGNPLAQQAAWPSDQPPQSFTQGWAAPTQVAQVAPPPPIQINPAKPSHTLETFRANIPLALADLQRHGKIGNEWMKQVFDYYQVSGVEKIMANPAISEDLFKQMVAQGLINQIG